MNTFMFKLGMLMKEAWPFGAQARYREGLNYATKRHAKARQEFTSLHGSPEAFTAKEQPANRAWYAKERASNLAGSTGGAMQMAGGRAQFAHEMNRAPATAVAAKAPAAKAPPKAVASAAPAAKPPASMARAPASPLQVGGGRGTFANGRQATMAQGNAAPKPQLRAPQAVARSAPAKQPLAVGGARATMPGGQTITMSRGGQTSTGSAPKALAGVSRSTPRPARTMG